MSWYQSLSWLEIIFGTIFLFLYAGYIYRIKKLATYFKKPANAIFFKFALRSLYFFLLLIALLGPSFGAMKKEIKNTGKDMLVLVDLSASMNTKDVAPSRLDRVKHEINQFIPALNADRIGLITFSSEAFLSCPFTYDQSALQLYTRLLNTTQVPAAAADYKPALELALQKFSLLTAADSTLSKARLVILLSDGEDFGSDVRPVLQRYFRNDIRVFTVGIGTPEGGPVPTGNSFKKDKNGNRVISRLQSDHLKDIAAKTNGQYFQINNTQNQTDDLIQTINNIEGEKRESREIDITANKYIYPLLAALILIMLDILLTVTVIKI